MSNLSTFEAVLEEIKQTHKKKSSDYSNLSDPFSNFKEAALSSGVTTQQVFEVMIGIKQARIKQLLQPGRTPQNESLEDSLLDRAVYAILALTYYREEKLCGRFLTGRIENYEPLASAKGCNEKSSL